jgi:hypothetical protein
MVELFQQHNISPQIGKLFVVSCGNSASITNGTVCAGEKRKLFLFYDVTHTLFVLFKYRNETQPLNLRGL